MDRIPQNLGVKVVSYAPGEYTVLLKGWSFELEKRLIWFEMYSSSSLLKVKHNREKLARLPDILFFQNLFNWNCEIAVSLPIVLESY